MKTKHTSEEKLESKEIQTEKYVQRVYLKTSCKKSFGRLKESRKIMFDVKAVLLVVPKLVKVVFSRYIASTINSEFGQVRDCLVGNIR
jgi:hypothetical protein